MHIGHGTSMAAGIKRRATSTLLPRISTPAAGPGPAGKRARGQYALPVGYFFVSVESSNVAWKEYSPFEVKRGR
jgi:hypothetical protein